MKRAFHISLVVALAAVQARADDWSTHGQLTTIVQGYPPFQAPYSGPNSLSPEGEGRTSLTSTFFLGRRLWQGGALFVDPEVIAGQGFSHTLGVAGFPNGETTHVDSPSPKILLARLYYQQRVGFGNETEKIESDQNQLAETIPVQRLSFIGGKFSLTDFFDNNVYAHDARTQFMNLALVANGAWDYAADSRGYTYGFYVEYNRASWALRAASAMEPKEANQLDLDHNIHDAHGDEVELEGRYHAEDHPGKIRLLAYWNHAHMGNYQTAITNGELAGTAPDITTTRSYTDKYGFGFSLEQEILSDVGFFSRAGWNDGKTETWAFTEIDQTASLGFSLKGTRWSRPQDVFASAYVINGLSPEHRTYLGNGGLGFIIGDGQLNYAPEQIWETYYAVRPWKYLTLTPDIQLIKNPAYNADRGPVIVGGIRLHLEF